jgi:hypothetical protein
MSVDPRDVYRQGIRFLVTDVVLRRKVESEPDLEESLKYPGMVISAFASELFLKCLKLIDGKGTSNSHKLAELFGDLSHDTQALIRAEWDTMLAVSEPMYQELERKHRVKIPRDLNTSLAECGEAFMKLRYIYELPKGSTFYITQLPLVLKNVVKKLKPDWEL